MAGAPTSLAGYVCPGTVLTQSTKTAPDAVVVDSRTAASITYPKQIGAGYARQEFGPVTLLTRPGLPPRAGC